MSSTIAPSEPLDFLPDLFSDGSDDNNVLATSESSLMSNEELDTGFTQFMEEFSTVNPLSLELVSTMASALGELVSTATEEGAKGQLMRSDDKTDDTKTKDAGSSAQTVQSQKESSPGHPAMTPAPDPTSGESAEVLATFAIQALGLPAETQKEEAPVTRRANNGCPSTPDRPARAPLPAVTTQITSIEMQVKTPLGDLSGDEPPKQPETCRESGEDDGLENVDHQPNDIAPGSASELLLRNAITERQCPGSTEGMKLFRTTGSTLMRDQTVLSRSTIRRRVLQPDQPANET